MKPPMDESKPYAFTVVESLNSRKRSPQRGMKISADEDDVWRAVGRDETSIRKGEFAGATTTVCGVSSTGASSPTINHPTKRGDVMARCATVVARRRADQRLRRQVP